MAEIEMYATQTCDYCADARTLFKKKGVTYKEIDVTGSKELRKEMTKRANGATRSRRSSSTANISGLRRYACDGQKRLARSAARQDRISLA